MPNRDFPDNQDRKLEKALTNKIIDGYFGSSESWLRAILRMCYFSLGYVDGQRVFVVECPNQAVAKRLSRKTYPFRGVVYYLTDDFSAGGRSLFCYWDEKQAIWNCFDTRTTSWKPLTSLNTKTATTDG